MRYIVIILAMVVFSGCRSSKPLLFKDLRAVHILFQDSSWGHRSGYKLYDGNIIHWDKRHTAVRNALSQYRSRIESLPKDDFAHLRLLLENKTRYRYRPIKVLPLKEFGYIETATGDTVFYGIMGPDGFIDLTANRIYL